ncbi:hypothetical protein GOP47_0030196 [Adiantum capillus-veneris]|nr:hypothetical protein GOP47_0030196 [Adiantum capillus-veneris]
MSPQRRKGRGGGAGKVAALPPSSAALLSIDPSPSSLPHKPSRQRNKALPGILPASCKSSSTSSSVLCAKLKSKERPKAITASSEAFLSATNLCNAHAAPKSRKCAECIAPPHPSTSCSISKPRKCVNHEKVSLSGSAFARARTQKAFHDKEERGGQS